MTHIPTSCETLHIFVSLSLSHTHTHIPGVTKAIRRMNKRMNLPNLQKIMMQFERESEIMDMKEEAISDTMDDVLGEEDDEEVTVTMTTKIVGSSVCELLDGKSLLARA